MLEDGYSYGKIGKMLLPDVIPNVSKGIIYRFHKKNDMPGDNTIRMMLGLPRYRSVQETEIGVPCFKCGIVHQYDCVNQKAVAIDAQIKDPPQPPRHLRRFTVYPGTDSAKIADGLLRVTGVRWVAVEDEIRY